MTFISRFHVYVGIHARKGRKRQRMVLKPYPQAARRRLLVLIAKTAANCRIPNNVAVVLLVKAVHVPVRIYPVFIYVECAV